MTIMRFEPDFDGHWSYGFQREALKQSREEENKEVVLGLGILLACLKVGQADD